ncbi:MAG: HAMP domain-containing protein [Chloroflexi bacterium]|nr:HAMP domain-containing protein [Chloroflexota bacterium]
MNRLFFRLLGAFAIVVLTVVAVVFLIANQTTTSEFRAYMFRGGMAPSSQVARELAAFHAARGNWQGVDEYFTGTFDSRMGSMMSSRRAPATMMNPPMQLADTNGVIIAGWEASVGQRASATQLAQGVPIQVGDQTVGTLIAPAMSSSALDTQQQEFLFRVNVSILVAGVVAGLIAFVLGVALVYQITAPLKSLASAANKIAAGDFTAHVVKPGTDEIGHVGRAFNAMADSLARSETARRNMIADIAHELRTPLGVMRGQLEGMMDGVFAMTPDQLASLHEETLLLARLVDDLRELALADAGQLQIHRAPSDLGALIEKTVAAFAPQAAEKNIALETNVMRAVPRVNLDDHRIEQVLRNLIGNALRHTPVSGTISVQCSADGVQPGFIRVSVSDTGAGLAQEDLPRVFERFWRGDKSRSRAGGGAGLGLAIAKQLVVAHGGAIGVASDPGRGATFWFTLPV